MRRSLVFLLPATFLLTIGFAHAGMGGRLTFGHDFKKGMAKADKEGKPVAIYFTANW